MELKTGDRYEFYCDYAPRPFYASIIEWTGNGWLVIEGIAKGNLETVESFAYYNELDYTYLGNFAKASNFDTLYNLFNQ